MMTIAPKKLIEQPATPQPQYNRYRLTTTRSGSNGSVREIARKFDSQKGFQVSIAENPANDASNQEETRETQVATPLKHRSVSRNCNDQEESEAGPLKRLSVTHHLQQQHQILHQHHRRISTDTAMFSRMIRKQPSEDINSSVVQYFTQLPVATISRPEHGSNQVEEDSDAMTIDPVELLAIFKRGETTSVASALAIVQRATEVMTLEQNVVCTKASFTVVGDLHGQFSDLVELFNVHGLPSASNPYLFLGDYVDRGVSSCEIILVLLALKVRFPQSIYLLRGNHECRSLSTFYGFRTECLKKYGIVTYNRMIKCFESMPLAAKITTSQGVFLAVHGGLSPSIQDIDEINIKVNRFMEPDPSGALCDLLWADPAKETAKQDEPFAPNSVRGCSYTFNEHVCRAFLERNKLLAIIRAHELEEDGFREHFTTRDGDQHQLPPVITVFSAPEYCNTNHNMGATLQIPWDPSNCQSGRLLEYRQHKRSDQREVEFIGSSEDEAVKRYLAEQLPFLPVDFYELVIVCRQLRATLDVAASISTPVSSSASNIIQEKSATGGELIVVMPSSATHPGPSKPPQFEERVSVDRTHTEVEERHQTIHVSRETLKPCVPESVSGAKARRRASTGSGFRLCPGFMRFCERFLGMHFEDPRARDDDTTTYETPTRSGPPKKRRSIDDITVGTASTPTLPTALGDVRTTSVADVQPTFSPSSSVPAFSQSGKNNLEIFTSTQWSALRLYFSLLDVSGSGVLFEEGFVVLLAEQDSDAYATQEELQLLMDLFDSNGDGLITPQDYLQFAYRAFLRWKKISVPRLSKA